MRKLKLLAILWLLGWVNLSTASWDSNRWPSELHATYTNAADLVPLTNVTALSVTDVWVQVSTTNFIPALDVSQGWISTDHGMNDIWRPRYGTIPGIDAPTRSWTNTYFQYPQVGWWAWSTSVAHDVTNTNVSYFTTGPYFITEMVEGELRSHWRLVTNTLLTTLTKTIVGDADAKHVTVQLGTNLLGEVYTNAVITNAFTFDVFDMWSVDIAAAVDERNAASLFSGGSEAGTGGAMFYQELGYPPEWVDLSVDSEFVYQGLPNAYGNLKRIKRDIGFLAPYYLDLTKADTNGTFETFLNTPTTNRLWNVLITTNALLPTRLPRWGEDNTNDPLATLRAWFSSNSIPTNYLEYTPLQNVNGAGTGIGRTLTCGWSNFTHTGWHTNVDSLGGEQIVFVTNVEQVVTMVLTNGIVQEGFSDLDYGFRNITTAFAALSWTQASAGWSNTLYEGVWKAGSRVLTAPTYGGCDFTTSSVFGIGSYDEIPALDDMGYAAISWEPTGASTSSFAAPMLSVSAMRSCTLDPLDSWEEYGLETESCPASDYTILNGERNIEYQYQASFPFRTFGVFVGTAPRGCRIDAYVRWTLTTGAVVLASTYPTSIIGDGHGYTLDFTTVTNVLEPTYAMKDIATPVSWTVLSGVFGTGSALYLPIATNRPDYDAETDMVDLYDESLSIAPWSTETNYVTGLCGACREWETHFGTDVRYARRELCPFTAEPEVMAVIKWNVPGGFEYQ